MLREIPSEMRTRISSRSRSEISSVIAVGIPLQIPIGLCPGMSSNIHPENPPIVHSEIVYIITFSDSD